MKDVRYDYIPVYTEDEKSAKVFTLFLSFNHSPPNKYFIGFVKCNVEFFSFLVFIYFIDGTSHSLRGLLVSLTHLTDTNFIK